VTWEVDLRGQVGKLRLDAQIRGEAKPTTVIGPNGAGKTSLLRMIAGAHRPLSGRIAIGNRILFDSTTGDSLPPEARRIGYVPQGYGLFPHLRVIDNVSFGLSVGPGRIATEERRAVARELLEELGCAHLSERFPARLSGGEQQRVALARALVVKPELLLLDEPLATLDPSSRRRLRTFLSGYLESRPAIVVTHDVRDVEALGDDIVVLEGGLVTQRGTSTELRARPATEFIAEFFDSPSGPARDAKP